MGRTRREKYPDTNTFTFYNRNPHNRFTSDCVIRAISTATGKPYEDVVVLLAGIQCKTGFCMNDRYGYGKLLTLYGWKMHKQPRKANGRKYTGKEFCKALKSRNLNVDHSEKIIAHIGTSHIVAIMDYKVLDTWDSTDGCIGNYWTKE